VNAAVSEQPAEFRANQICDIRNRKFDNKTSPSKPLRLQIIKSRFTKRRVYYNVRHCVIYFSVNPLSLLDSTFLWESKGFWRWCVTLTVTEFMNFIHCLLFKITWTLDISELGSFSVFRWGKGDRVGISLPQLKAETGTVFEMSFYSYLKFLTLDYSIKPVNLISLILQTFFFL
jgi:hypothetical protein